MVCTCKRVNEECAGEAGVGGSPEVRRIPAPAHSPAEQLSLRGHEKRRLRMVKIMRMMLCRRGAWEAENAQSSLWRTACPSTTGSTTLSPGIAPLHPDDPGQFESLVRRNIRQVEKERKRTAPSRDLHWLEGRKYED